MRGMIRFLFSIVVFAVAQNASAACFIWPENVRMQASTVTEYLDCIAREPRLNKLSAQWIILKKSLWQLQDSNSSSVSHRFANNVMNPMERNTMAMNFTAYTWRNFASLLKTLETDVFPKALKGFTDKSEDNKTSWSFEAMAYQTIAFVETPVNFNQAEGLNTTGRSYYYAGTLEASQNLRGSSLDNIAAYSPALQLQFMNREQTWPQLRSLYRQLRPCESEADCLIRQDRAIAQGLFLTLEHPALVSAVHFQRHVGFGTQSAQYKGAQEMLPTSYGCAVKAGASALPSDIVITGYLSYDYTMKNLLQFGRWGFLGRPLYLGAMNKQNIQSNNRIAGQFQGQNAIIRDISDAAVYDLAQLGGLGSQDPKMTWQEINVKFSDGNTYPLNWHLNENVNDVIQNRLTGVSRLMADYQSSPYRSASSTAVQVNSSTFFQQTILSFGWSFAKWTERLRAWNPPVHYYVYAYDYGLRSAPSTTTWKSYYDRVVWVSQNMFPNVEGVP